MMMYRRHLMDFQKDKLWGLINKKGEEFLSPKYNQIENFKKGFAIVEKNNLYGVIDLYGDEVVPPICKEIAL